MEALEFLKKYALLDEQESKEPQWIRIANIMDAYHKQKLEQSNVSGSLPQKTEIESVLREVYDDTLAKWSSHLEVDAGISEYATEIIKLFGGNDR